MTKYIYMVVVLMVFNMANAQEIRYVNADNGLFLRDKPSQDSKRLDKLVYGTQLEITERTHLNLDVQDNNHIVSGQWVKVSCTDDIHNNRTGYVFNGFLSEEKLNKRFRVGFEEFTMEFENLNAEMIDNPQTTTYSENKVDAILELGETVENKILRIRHHSKFKKIEVFQRHENSITIMNEGPHCDLTEWKHYYSVWEPLKANTKNNVFTTMTYGPKAWNKFIKVNVDEYKQAVKKHCGEEWFDLIKDSKSINNASSGVSINKIYFKVIFTTMHDENIEKIVAFDIPMGC